MFVSVVTIFLGIRLEDLDLDDAALYTMVAYCVGVALVIIFEIYLAVTNVGRASFSTMGGGKDGTLLHSSHLVHFNKVKRNFK